MSRKISLNKKTNLKQIGKNKTDFEMQDKILKNYSEQKHVLLDRISKIELPKENKQLRIVTSKSISSLAFIEKILNSTKIEESYFVIFSISKKTGRILNNLISENELGKCKVLMSNFMTRNKEAKKMIIELFSLNKNLDLKMASSHAKVILLNGGGNYYIIEGSMNLSANSRIEQMTFENSKEVYDFHKGWIEEIFNTEK